MTMRGRRPMIVAAISVISAVGCGDDANDAAASRSAVQVIARTCANIDEYGSGLVIESGLVLTAAHVIAGASSITVTGSGAGDGGPNSAAVVAFDPNNDLAVLAVDTGLAPAIPIGSAESGDIGEAIVYRGDTQVALPITIVRDVIIRTEDIYIKGETERPGYELDAEIQSGDSGGVVVVDGEAVAVIWSRSRQSDQRAWAIDPNAPNSVLDQLATGSIPDEYDPASCFG